MVEQSRNKKDGEQESNSDGEIEDPMMALSNIRIGRTGRRRNPEWPYRAPKPYPPVIVIPFRKKKPTKRLDPVKKNTKIISPKRRAAAKILAKRKKSRRCGRPRKISKVAKVPLQKKQVAKRPKRKKKAAKKPVRKKLAVKASKRRGGKRRG